VQRLPFGRATRRSRNQSGAVAVEFALIMPILFMIVFGIIEFGYMLNRDMIVGNASRDGARVASLNGTYTEIRDTITTELAASGIPTTSPSTTITIDCKKADDTPCYATSSNYDTLAQPGATAIVTVRYVHRWITPGLAFLGSTLTLEQVTHMRVE
jgi:Flp pilus assembly protein TadG